MRSELRAFKYTKKENSKETGEEPRNMGLEIEIEDSFKDRRLDLKNNHAESKNKKFSKKMGRGGIPKTIKSGRRNI